jgi:hypothetical protein
MEKNVYLFASSFEPEFPSLCLHLVKQQYTVNLRQFRAMTSKMSLCILSIFFTYILSVSAQSPQSSPSTQLSLTTSVRRLPLPSKVLLTL